MSLHRYILEPYKGMRSRYTCPGCGKRQTFTRYIDTQTGQHLADTVGKCNREINCAYHYTPKQFFESNRPLFQNHTKPEFSYIIKSPKKSQIVPAPYHLTRTKQASFIPVETFKQSLSNHAENGFVQFIISRFGTGAAAEVISRYFIGSSKHLPGATVFWQIDKERKIRTGKIMLYNACNGKRSKQEGHRPTWVHSVLKLPDFSLQQCFFGEHLLRGNVKPVAICESEKTAIIASLYLPGFVWLACGSLTGLSEEKCNALQGRAVVLFPDLKGFDKWQAKAKELFHLASFSVSDLLEKKASEAHKAEGLDLADYLLGFPVSAFAPSVINLQASAIADLPSSHQTGNEFQRIIIQGVKTKDNRFYDLFFTAEGELIKPDAQAGFISLLATYFEKNLQSATLDGQPCLIHVYN